MKNKYELGYIITEYKPLHSRDACIIALDICSSQNSNCSECPYHNDVNCCSIKDRDALYYLQNQEA